ncbi:PIEZO2_1 [Blepharisma stoltei]|uniref:Piezo-type mechanosensitive ion channel component n=1 Tax=Blepharisma stoltei TaxID=1481888 RepID=A0AAU9I9K2_9CILI|nr:unnamed protein product [Blepharisma stoltei]
MIEECLSMVILLCGSFAPSLLSFVYIGFTIGIWLTLMFFYQVPRFLYQTLTAVSTLFLLWKIVVLILFYFNQFPDFFSDYDWLLKYLGIHLSRNKFEFKSSLTFLPDICTFIIGIIGIFYAKRSRIKPSEHKHVKRARLFTLFLLLCCNCVINFSIVNLFYLFVIFYWAISWSLRCWNGYRIGCRIVCFITILQVLFSALYYMLWQDYVSESDVLTYGIILKSMRGLPDYIIVFFMHGFSLSIGRKILMKELKVYMKKLKTDSIEDENLEESKSIEEIIVINTEMPRKAFWKSSKIPEFIRYFFSVSVVYFFARVLIFSWIIRYRSFVGILLMLWLFYSFLDYDLKRILQVSKYSLFPILILNFFGFYIINLFQIDVSEVFGICLLKIPPLEIAFQLLTILLFLYLNNILQRKKRDKHLKDKDKSVVGLFVRIIVENADKLSLCVLFVVGLSDINLLHTGFMIICLIFMLNTKLAKNHWTSLVIYTMFLLLFRYIWILAFPLKFTDYIPRNYLRLVGMPANRSELTLKNSIIPYDYLVWILLVSASMQLKAYRSTTFSILFQQFNRVNVSVQHPLLVKVLVLIYEWYFLTEVWVLYSVIMITVMVSSLNLLNFIRLLIVASFMIIHLRSPLELKVGKNYFLVRKIWFILEYISGIILVIRYLYQFLPFFYDVKQYPLFGLEVFSSSTLYGSMVSDCILLIVTVLGAKAFKKEDNINYGNSDGGIFDDIGLLSGIIKVNLSRKPEEKSIKFFNYFEEFFPFFIYLTISIFSVYWRLSISMNIYLISICISCAYLGYYFTRVSLSLERRNLAKEHKIRSYCWNVLWYFTLIYVVISYACFMITRLIFHEIAYDNIIWLYFFSGFTKKSDNSFIISENYGYIIIAILLIIERHCLEYMMNRRILNKEISAFEKIKILIKFLNFMRVFAESMIPLFMLLMAFSKLTFVGLTYVVSVFVSIYIKSPYYRTLFLYIVIIFMCITQYTLILSNIQKGNSPHKMPHVTYKPFDTPWYNNIDWRTKDYATFLNLGTSISQLHSIFYDLLTFLFILGYYTFLSTRESELEGFEDSIEPKLSQSHSSSDTNITRKTRGRKIFKFVKKAMYNMSHILILIFVLIFISLSYGVVSSLYCLFCLIFIFKANEVIRNEESWNSYLKYLRNYFLVCLLVDLTLQMIYQIPSAYIHDDKFRNWILAFGIFRLWSAGEDDEPSDLSERRNLVRFKVFTFAFLYIMYRMMKSQDYQDFMRTQRQKIYVQSKRIGFEMAQHFNNKRIKHNKQYQDKRKRFENEIRKLDMNVSKWNKKFYLAEQGRASIGGIRSRSRMTSTKLATSPVQPTYLEIGTSEIKSIKVKFQNLLISLINPILYKNYVKKIKTRKKKKIYIKPKWNREGEGPFDRENEEECLDPHLDEIKEEEEAKESDIEEEKEGEKTPDEVSPRVWGRTKTLQFLEDKNVEDSDEEVNFSEDQAKNKSEYDLKWKDYFILSAYVVASNTQALVYLFFFVNHIIYASMESVALPIFTIGYSMLEYPRPPAKYFRFMLLYTETVFFIKFSLQLDIWNYIFANGILANYHDTLKTGFNLTKNTYSENLFNYILWDAMVMLFLLIHEYYLLRVGLWNQTEIGLETLETAKSRFSIEDDDSFIIAEDSAPRIMSRLSIINQIPRSQEVIGFFKRLLPHNKEEKPGEDLYTPTIIIQLVILFYLICFFGNMDGTNANISKAFKANQFQGRMVVALIFHVTLILLERYLYLERTSQALKLALYKATMVDGQEQRSNMISRWNRPLKVKLTLHILLLLTIHALVFWYFPINGTQSLIGKPTCTDLYDKERCNNFQINDALQWFYVLYMIYFITVSLQIRYGMPSFRTGSFPLMRSTSRPSKILFQIYRGFPFMFELRTIIDWAFTPTALDLFQWIKFEEIHAQLYITQCIQKRYAEHPRGEKMDFLSKFAIGGCGLFLILIVILTPLILFSSLNPIIELNKVKTMGLEFGILVEDNNYFKLYLASRVVDIHDVTDTEWNQMGLQDLKEIQATDKELTQVITIPTTSDSIWDIAPPSKLQLCNSFVDGLGPKNTKISMQLSYTFVRDFPTTQQRTYTSTQTSLDKEEITYLNSMICLNHNQTFIYPDLKRQIFKLPSTGTKITPEVLLEEHHTSQLVLSLIPITNEFSYWEMIDADGKNSGLSFITISEYYSPATFDFSVLTFYISVVYVAGRLLRMALSGGAQNIVLTDIPNSEPLINMCTAVHISRMTGDLLKEEEMYYELIDIMRSPEIIKILTGRSSIKEKID